MSRQVGFCLFFGLILSGSLAIFAQRGAPQANRPDNPQSLAHIGAAKMLAGDDAFLAYPFNFFCVAGNARAQNNNAPDLEPTKLFDNVYAVGNSETAVYALTSSEGIVLLDAGFENKAEALVAQLQKVNLDPARVKYIFLGHGHADHFGGARFFQDKYKTKVAAAAADWDLINAPGGGGGFPNRGGGGGAKPSKDVTLEEGKPFQFGDLTITPVAIPGHTPGSLAFIFPAKDGAKTRMAGLFGGTVLTTGILTTDALKQYTQSITHYLGTAKTMNVEVEIQNHPIFDGSPDRLARLRAAKPGEPNPFVIGNDRYLKMWNIVSECIQAEIARRDGA
ncbi:MAG TPA: MBL fold metallo-hydrolase [Terriglobia bacterium]|nr:MBL fold metallo-hydrolase [Terriglobia bacterium]